MTSEEMPSQLCKEIVKANRHLCWTSEKAWEMEQRDICLICMEHNRQWFYGAALSAARIQGTGEKNGGFQAHF
jgi:hypothetical protein